MKRTPLKKVNRKRRASEFARAYGSRERVRFVKSLPCCACGRTPSENAHTKTGGMGRKADAHTIAPLCRDHHQILHTTGRHWFAGYYGISLQLEAAATEAAWIAHQQENT